MAKHLSEKVYLNSLSAHINNLNTDELKKLVIDIASEIPAKGRLEVLEKLGISLSEGSNKSLVKELLQGIDSLVKEIEERVDLIENGEYEDLDDWDDDDYDDYGRYRYYHDDCPDYVTEDQNDDLQSFKKQTDLLFLSGNIKDARTVYEKLIAAIKRIDDMTSSGATPWGEWQGPAYYCRCVYECSTSTSRVNDFAKAMEEASPPELGFVSQMSVSKQSFPLLTDVIESQRKELPERDSFMKPWRTFLECTNTSRAKILLIETMLLDDNLQDAESWLRQHGKDYPIAWLFLLDQLSEKKNWEVLAENARYALSALQEEDHQLKAAQSLYSAGQMLKQPELIVEGIRERFLASPSRAELKDLLNTVTDPQALEAELNIFDQHLAKQEFSRIRALVLLLRGDLDKLLAVQSPKSPYLGWNYSNNFMPLLLSGVFLAMLPRKSDLPANAKSFITRHLENGRHDGDWYIFDSKVNADDQADSSILTNAIRNHINAEASGKERILELVEWSRKAAGKRVDAIVANKHRKSYWKAAQVLAAWVEVMTINGFGSDAQNTLSLYRDTKYNRHSAFRSELKTACASIKSVRSAKP